MQICPPTEQYPKVFDSENNCRLPEALKHIEEKCHDQQVCSMVTAPEVFGGGQGGRDPCPGFRKYVEVAYKCKPTQFRSKTSCQGDTMNLTCLVKDSPEPPQFIFWFHNQQEISYDSPRGGVSQITEKGED